MHAAARWIRRGPSWNFVKFPSIVTVAQLAEFDEVIDVRSPSEFAKDHVPGATNCPVLDDAERAAIGTMYAQVSPFSSKNTAISSTTRAI